MGSVITEPGRTTRPTWWVLRWTAAVHLLVVVAQPVLAGRFMAGDYDMLGLHGTNGIVVAVVGMALVVAAALTWRRGNGLGRAAWGALGIGVADSVQAYAGFSRDIGIHVPLGVALVVAAVWLTGAVWRPEVVA